MTTVYKLVLLRHGQSTWNLENRFTGWTDVGLTEQGMQEAHTAGKAAHAKAAITFDMAYTSVLKRAIKTLWIVMEEMELEWIPVYRAWQLNERHYGALQGLNKAEMAVKFGEAQVKIWRRSYDVPPPPLDWDDPRHPRFDRRYAGLTKEELPACESLKDTVDRMLPYWHSNDRPGGKIGPARAGRRPRQQPARPGQVPGQYLGQRDRRAEHPHRHPAGVRTGRRPEAAQQLLPGRRGDGQESRRSRCQPGQGKINNERAGAGRPLSHYFLRKGSKDCPKANPARPARPPTQINVSCQKRAGNRRIRVSLQ